MAMNKLNNKGYMLVEIILASVIAFGVAYAVINLTIKLKNKNDDLMVETQVVTDQTIITNKLMKYIIDDNEIFDCNAVTIDDKTVKYKGNLIDIVNDFADIGDLTKKCDSEEIEIIIPLNVKQIPDKDFNVNINYKIEGKKSFFIPSNDIPNNTSDNCYLAPMYIGGDIDSVCCVVVNWNGELGNICTSSHLGNSHYVLDLKTFHDQLDEQMNECRLHDRNGNRGCYSWP